MRPDATSRDDTGEALQDTEQEVPLLAWFAALGSLVLALAALLAWRRRRPDTAPTIERPTVPPAAAAVPAKRAINLRPQVHRLTRSFMALTIDGDVTVLNRSGDTLRDIALAGSLTTANGQRTEDHVLDTIGQLGPGQSRRLPFSLRLPVAQAGVLRQGQVPMTVPLLDLAVRHGGEEHRSAYAVGPTAPGQVAVKGTAGRVQPIRLDEPPRTYETIALRPVDEAAGDAPSMQG